MTRYNIRWHSIIV